MIRRAVILAAGRGTRLGAATEAVPKPLIEVGGQPIITHILDGLAAAGIGEAIVVTGYRAQQLEAAAGALAPPGLALRFLRQERLEGTARALALARRFLDDEPFFFAWGDILVDPGNYRRVVAAAAGDEAAVLAVNEVDDPWAGAAVYADAAGRVTRIVEKPPRGSSTTRWNNAGFGILGPRIWPAVEQLAPSPRGEWELPRAIASLVADGHFVRAVAVDGPWFDIGTPADLEAARAAFAAASRPGISG